jgi:hypothetical protein
MIDGGEPHDHPVVALVRGLRHQELVGFRVDERPALLLGEREAHERLVA